MNDTTQRNKMTLEEAELILEEYLGFPHTDTPLEYDYKKPIFNFCERIHAYFTYKI